MPLTLLAFAAILFHGLLSQKPTRHHLALLAVLCLSCFWFFSNEGRWFQIFPKDSIYTQKRGNQPLQTYFHWHEIYHYYLGGKYFSELGYNHLYEAVALADSESAMPQLRVNGMRNLGAPTQFLPMPEALQHARDVVRPAFSDARWTEFKADLEQLKSIAGGQWLDLGMFDAGYNPPPTWAVIGGTMANLIPITQEHAWIEGRPSWYQAEFLPLCDALMLLVLIGFIFRAFGPVGGCLFIALFALSYVAKYSWINGGFFRFTWLFSLGMGLCFLKEKKFFWAGIFMGLTTVDRIFPIVFAAGAALPLLYRWWSTRKIPADLIRYIQGGLLSSGILILLSLAIYGTSAWGEFFDKIGKHNELYFVNHIGYKRVAVFDDSVPNQNFWWEQGLRNFAGWNERLVNKWDDTKLYHAPFMLLLIIGTLLAARKTTPEESALLFGGTILFLFAIPANYYYAYFPLIALLVFHDARWRSRSLILGGFFMLWAYVWIALSFSRDDLIQNYYICLGFLTFFLLWISTRTYESCENLSLSPFSEPKPVSRPRKKPASQKKRTKR